MPGSFRWCVDKPLHTAPPVLCELKHQLIHVAPRPVLSRLERADHRMTVLVKMLRRVASRRGITTAHMPAGQAKAKMNPGRSGLQTFLAAAAAGSHIPNLIQM